MSKKSDEAYVKFNLQREKQGLRTVGRRDFMRLMAAASAGLSIPFMAGCTSETPITPVAGGGQSGVGGVETVATQTAGSTTPIVGSSGAGGSVSTQSAAGGKTANAGKGGSGGKAGASTGNKAGAGGAKADAGTATNLNSAKVGIIRNTDTTQAVKTAIELAGGLDAIKQGETVFIKPNISVATPGVFTSLPVIRGIVEAVSAKTDPKNITICECTSMGSPTAPAAAASGYTGLITELGINYIWFDDGDYAMYKDPKWTYLKTPKSVPVSVHPDTKQYDHFILAPILKNHSMVNAWIPNCNVDFTCCMKLFIGVLPYSGTGGRSDSADDPHRAEMGECVAELNCIVPKVTMCVVDALSIGIVGGPTPTQSAKAGLIIASSDRVACDSVAFATLKNYGKATGQTYVTRSVWEQSQIKRAGELKLGIADPKKITIVDKDVDNIADIKAQWV
jgi:uncharacterized protein (DUF362 family)